MSDQKRTPRQGSALPGKSPRPSPAAGSTAAGSASPKGSGAKPPPPKTAPPVRSNPATRSIPVIKPQQPASNGRPGPAEPAGKTPGQKPAKSGKAGRTKAAAAKRPAAPKQGTVPKGLLGGKSGAKRPAVRPGPGAKQNSGPADEPTPATPAPPVPASPQAGDPRDAAGKTGTDASQAMPAPVPDLSAHTESPAWLSPDGSRDAELWDGAFDADARDAAPVEPQVVPAEDVHLAEPSLETPAISSDAAEAASLPETAAEVRAVSEEAAEAGRQAGISEPAPEGTEIAVEPGEGLTELEPSAAAGAPEEAAGGDKSREDQDGENKTAGDNAGGGNTAGDQPAEEAAGDKEAGIPKPDSASKATEPPAIRTSTVQAGSTDVAAPVTDSFESLTLSKKDPEDAGLTHTVNPSGSSAVPADSRRARRTREAEEAAARGKGAGKTTRTLVLLGSILIVVLLVIWLATVIADSNREAGVLEDSVSPVDLETGACLKDFRSVNAEVTVVTCETAHNAQLVASQTYADSDSFPGTDALAAKAEEVCSSVIYTDAASKYTDLELNRAVPTQSSWDTGDRRVDCFVVAPGEDLTETLIVQP